MSVGLAFEMRNLVTQWLYWVDGRYLSPERGKYHSRHYLLSGLRGSFSVEGILEDATAEDTFV